MISPWERERANGTETRIISSFIDCGIGCFPLRAGRRETTTYFLFNLLRDSSLLYLFWKAFGRRTCDECSTKNLSLFWPSHSGISIWYVSHMMWA
jgi:hypothetical protein